MNLFKIVIFTTLIMPGAHAGLGFYCKNALSLALKGYSYHKDYKSSLKNIEMRLYTIKMLTNKMINEKKPSAKDKKKVLSNFKNLNGHFLKHKQTITQISSATSCAENMVKEMNRLQGTIKKKLTKTGIRDLNKSSTNIIETLNSIK